MQDCGVSARGPPPPLCTLKESQREYNSFLVNALNRIFKSNLSLNNFKWLLTKLKLSVRSKYSDPVLENASEMDTPLSSKSGASKSRPCWAAHTHIMYGSTPHPGRVARQSGSNLVPRSHSVLRWKSLGRGRSGYEINPAAAWLGFKRRATAVFKSNLIQSI